jgi:hypothetical protein
MLLPRLARTLPFMWLLAKPLLLNPDCKPPCRPPSGAAYLRAEVEEPPPLQLQAQPPDQHRHLLRQCRRRGLGGCCVSSGCGGGCGRALCRGRLRVPRRAGRTSGPDARPFLCPLSSRLGLNQHTKTKTDTRECTRHTGPPALSPHSPRPHPPASAAQAARHRRRHAHTAGAMPPVVQLTACAARGCVCV